MEKVGEETRLRHACQLLTLILFRRQLIHSYFQFFEGKEGQAKEWKNSPQKVIPKNFYQSKCTQETLVQAENTKLCRISLHYYDFPENWGKKIVLSKWQCLKLVSVGRFIGPRFAYTSASYQYQRGDEGMLEN